MLSVAEIMDSLGLAVIDASQDPLKPGATRLRLLQDNGFRGHLADRNPEGWALSRTQLYWALKEMSFPRMAIEVLAHMHRYASEMRQS